MQVGRRRGCTAARAEMRSAATAGSSSQRGRLEHVGAAASGWLGFPRACCRPRAAPEGEALSLAQPHLSGVVVHNLGLLARSGGDGLDDACGWTGRVCMCVCVRARAEGRGEGGVKVVRG